MKTLCHVQTQFSVCCIARTHDTSQHSHVSVRHSSWHSPNYRRLTEVLLQISSESHV